MHENTKKKCMGMINNNENANTTGRNPKNMNKTWNNARTRLSSRFYMEKIGSTGIFYDINNNFIVKFSLHCLHVALICMVIIILLNVMLVINFLVEEVSHTFITVYSEQ